MAGLSTPGDMIGELYRVLQDRKTADPGTSYVASLYRKGPLVREIADLWFHTLVLMAQREIAPERVTGELARRFGTSGHAEKAARPQTLS